MVQAIRDLAEAARAGGTVQTTCVCGNVALWSPHELDRYWAKKGWDRSWRGFAKHLKCSCGERNPRIAWLVTPPPHDDDPPPPRPRFTRSALPKAPAPIDFVAYRNRKVG